jgi:PAS domain S-box-containing protein
MSPLRTIDPATLLDMITEGVVLIQEDGRIAFANNSFAEICGVAGHTMTGLRFLEFVAFQDRPRVNRFLLELIQSCDPVKDRMEFSFVNRSGNEHLLEMNARNLTHDGNPNILATVSDITERRRTHNKLKKLLDLIPEVVLTTSPEDNTRIVNISNATEKLCAIPSEEFSSGTFHIFVKPSLTKNMIHWNTGSSPPTGRPNGSMTQRK